MIVQKNIILLLSTAMIFGTAEFNCSTTFGDYESDSDSHDDSEDDENNGNSNNTGGTTCVVTTTGAGNALFYVLSPVHDGTASHGGYEHASGGSLANTNCTSCHGPNLEGISNFTLPAANSSTGSDVTSLNPPCCTTCHGVKW